MKSKALLILIALFAAGMLLSACGGAVPAVEEPAAEAEEPAAEEPAAEEPAAEEPAAEEPSGPTTLTVWYKQEFTEATLELIEEWAAEFGELKGITVDLSFVTMADAPTAYVSAIESHTTPDAAMVPFWGPPRYYTMGALVDVTDIATALGEENDGWLKSSEEAIVFDGRFYGVPWANTTQPLYLRTDVMEALGWDERPETFEDLAEFARQATEYGDGELWGWGITYNRSDDGHLMVQQMLWNHGCTTTAEDGETVTFNSPECVAGCQYMADRYEEGSAAPGAIGWTDGGNNEAWLAGQIAITGNGPSIWYALNQDPALEDLRDSTQMYDWPEGPTGISTSIAEAFSWVIFDNGDPDRVELAKEWIEWLFAPERYDLIAESSWGQEGPAHNRGMETEFMRQPAFQYLREADRRASHQGYPGPYTPAAADVASEYVLPDMMVRVIVDGLTCEAAVEEAAGKIEAIYARYE
jgi:multiple sugar transport system substrate-binding protein